MPDLEVACNSLFSDPQLNELLELEKSGSDLLDVLRPIENQHSDILAWCFNSREGHDQGDSVLKDFLIEIYKASTKELPGDLLYGGGYTKDFVRYWTPGRIATSSFGSVMFLREYSISNENDGKDRIDLLIIDPDQKFIIVVENKAGSKLTEKQLNKYVDGINKQLRHRPRFKEYLTAFVALDRDHDSEPDDEDNVKKADDERWVLLNYEWLGAAAERAGHAIKRGNQAAVLLRSYCLRQSTQIEHADDQTRKLVHSLAAKHPVVLKELKNIRHFSSKPEEWQKCEDSSREYLLRMYMQTPALWDQLIDLSPIEMIDTKIRRELVLDEDNVELRRVYANYRTQGTDLLIGPDGEWPIHIQVKHINEKKDSKPLFRVGIKFRPRYLSEDKRSAVKELLSKEFRELTNSRIQENGKWLGLSTNLDIEAAKNKVLEMQLTLKTVFSEQNIEKLRQITH